MSLLSLLIKIQCTCASAKLSCSVRSLLTKKKKKTKKKQFLCEVCWQTFKAVVLPMFTNH